MVRIPPQSNVPINPQHQRLPHEVNPTLKNMIPQLFDIVKASLNREAGAMLHEVDKDFKKRFASDPAAAKKAVEQISLRAAKEGELSILEWAFERHIKFTGSHISAAASSGNLEVVKWLRVHGAPIGHYGLCKRAVESGNLEVVQWAINSGAPFELYEIYYTTTAAGHVPVLEWLRKNETELLKKTKKHQKADNFPQQILWAAVEYGQIGVLEWAKHNPDFTDEIWKEENSTLEEEAIRYKQADTLKWLVNRKASFSDDQEINA